MKNRFRNLALLCALLSAPAFAQDYVVQVDGIVCEFCSLGVAKKLRKLPFIDPNKYNQGVDVEIKKQQVTIAVKPGASLDQAALFAAIESGGYNPVQVFLLNADGSRQAYEP